MPDRVRLAVVMDPIGHIKPVKDSTLAMLLAAQARGWELLYLELGDIWLRDGEAWGRAAPLEVRNDLKNWYSRGEPRLERLGAFDVILMRKDPPFDTEYIYSTYILERAETAGALVVNGPQGLRDMNEKVFTAWFPECCAPTLITRSMPDMAAFLAEHGKIVVKPLYGMGGRSIFVVERGDKNSNVVFETLTDYGERFAIAGDRRAPVIVAHDTFVGRLEVLHPDRVTLRRLHCAANVRVAGFADRLEVFRHRAGGLAPRRCLLVQFPRAEEERPVLPDGSAAGQ